MGALLFCALAAHGEEPKATVTGRGSAKASSCTGAEKGAALDQGEELSARTSRLETPTDGLFKASPFAFRAGAGHDLAESDDV